VDEFGLIRRYFTRAARSPGVIVGVGDDGALVAPTSGMQQVQVIDTLVEGVHFPVDMQAGDIGYRVVAVNLSDIAAMGATPRWMTLALTLSDKDEPWVDDFAAGLFAAAREYDVELIGGDTTRGDAVVATVHVTGEVEEGKALLRSGARIGDTVYVSGTPGDAAAGLAQFGVSLPDSYLVNRFLRPTPRLELGRALAGLASACIDVSDGLVGDLAKLCEASGVGAEIDIDRLPVSPELVDAFLHEEAFEFALTGGDDYELCFTAQPDALTHLENITAIGTVTDSGKVVCRRGGEVVEIDDRGYRHFV
jgi:thiamine-monophosphate kinase